METDVTIGPVTSAYRRAGTEDQFVGDNDGVWGKFNSYKLTVAYFTLGASYKGFRGGSARL